MAGEGASIVILSRTSGEVEETARLILDKGGKAVHIVADVSRTSDRRAALEEALSVFGGVDILMNNAAIIGPVKPLHEIEGPEWEDAMGINLHAVQMFSREVVPYMAARGGGKIINVTSGLGEMVMSPLGAYSVAKGGVIHLTQIMASELRRHKIQVNGLDPGVMDTRLQADILKCGPEVLGEEVYADFRGLKERGELDPPERAAELAVFLASRATDSITGENGTEWHYSRLGFRPRG